MSGFRCTVCDGTMFVTVTRYLGTHAEVRYVPCSRCNPRPKPCSHCLGTGREPAPRSDRGSEHG